MFGIGRKEILTPVAYSSIIKSTEPTLVGKLPDTLPDEFASLDQLVEEYKSYQGMPRRLLGVWDGQRGAYAARIKAIESQVKGLMRISQALGRGFSPYEIPEEYCVAEVTVSLFSRRRDISSWFTAPVPPRIMETLFLLRKEKVFDVLVVASPHAEHFTDDLTDPGNEPLVVGYLERSKDNKRLSFRFGRGDTRVRQCIRVKRGVGFLVACFDPQKELRRQHGLDPFEEPKLPPAAS